MTAPFSLPAYTPPEIYGDDWEELKAWKLEDELEMETQALELAASPFGNVPDSSPLPF